MTPAIGRARLGPLAVLAVVAAVAVGVRAAGFRYVSDDDFARVTLAEGWVAHPRFDASGTSWLPFPFWVNGAAMAVLGRSVATARAVAPVLAAGGALLLYGIQRARGVGTGVAFAAVALGAVLPWNAWLTVATVPEAWTGLVIAAACTGVTVPRLWPCLGLALLTACLSRYEAWPVAAAFAVVVLGAARTQGHAGHAPNARPGARPAWAAGLTAALATGGPVAWMVWNRAAHGSATHFLDRVAEYRARMGLAPALLADRLLGYPRALVEHGGMLVLAGALGAVVLLAFRPTRRFAALALVLVVAQLAFLVYGDLRDGAPTHHPERALVGIFWVCAVFAAQGAAVILGAPMRRRWSSRHVSVVHALSWGAFGLAALAYGVTSVRAWKDHPGRSPGERREDALAQGAALREAGARELVVEPCAFEHFALIAAYGAPERVRIEEGRTKGPPCPRVTVVAP